MKRLFAIVITALLAISMFIGCQTEEPGQEQTKEYAITWIDEGGKTISVVNVKEGEIPSCNYSVTDTAEWDYTLDGWSTSADGDILSEIPTANADATYYARVSAVKQVYTVTFDTHGGSAVEAQNVEYGTAATMPEAPEYEGYKFIGWCKDADGNDAVDFEAVITGNVTYHAVWNEVLDAKALLNALLSGYDVNPFSYIPESMRTDFSANLVNADEIVSDYSSAVSVSDISYGFGEQWHMVLENIEQSMLFFNVLSVIEDIATVSVVEFNNYFDQNPSDNAQHAFKNGIYNVFINVDSETVFYVLDYTAELPLLGEQTVQIALSMNVESGERTARIQLGDANALTYKAFENSYEFAIKYLGVRRAMFSIERDENGNVNGSIYEHLTVSDTVVSSAAEFYIGDDYISVVGNKASGLIGFTGYINELYSAESGKMLGYEVKETLSSIVYDTLWFNLCDIGGINTIMQQAATEESAAKIFINGSSNEWKYKTVGGFGLTMLSRRFDIEFRTQYVYSYDAETGDYTEHAIKVPMLFVQEDHYDTLAEDIKAENKVTISVDVDNADLNKLLSDYDSLLPVFIENKDKVTVDIIIGYIGDKINFE